MLATRFTRLLLMTLLVCAAMAFSVQFPSAHTDPKMAIAAFAAFLLLPFTFCLLPSKLPFAFCLLPFAFCLLSGVVATNRYEWLKGVGFLTGCIACATGAWVAVLSDRRFVSRLTWLLGAAVLVTSLYGILQKAGWDILLKMAPGGTKIVGVGGFAGGTFGNGAFAIQFVAPVLCMLAAQVLRGSLPARLMAFCIYGIGCWFLLISESRAGLVSMVIGHLVVLSVYWTATRRSGLNRLWLMLAAGLFFILLIFGTWVSGIASRFILTAGTPQAVSSSYRMMIWRDSLQMLRENPVLGVGYWNYDLQIPAFAQTDLLEMQEGIFADERINRAHSDYLDFACETGLVGGLALALTFLGASIYSVRLAGKQTQYVGLAGALVGISTHALFDFPLYNPVSGMLAWTLAGTAAGAYFRSQKTAPSSKQQVKSGPAGRGMLSPLRLAGLSAGLIGVTALLYPWYQFLVSQALNRRASSYYNAKNPAAALDPLRQSRQVAPDNRETFRLLAAALRQTKNYREAEAVTRSWLELEPLSSSAHNALGYSLLYQDKTNDALGEFRKALALAPTNLAAAMNSASLSFLREDYATAWEMYQYVETRKPEMAYEQIKNYADAAKATGRNDEVIRLEKIMATRLQTGTAGVP